MMSEEIDLDQSDPIVKDPNKKAFESKLSSSAGDIVIQDSSLPKQSLAPSKKAPKRCIYFSDGVIEEYSSSSDDDDEEEDASEKIPTVASQAEEPLPSKNPKDMTWIPWLFHYVSFSGCSTLRKAESLGEKLGWHFGITSPKYYYEIEEFKRTKKEEVDKKSKEKSLNWNVPLKDQTVITLDPKKLPSSDFTELNSKSKDEKDSFTA